VAITWTEADQERVQGRLVAIVSELPGVVISAEHGHTGFLIRGGRFAWLLCDHHGDGRLALWVKAPPGEQDALVGADPVRYFVPPYVGANGWVGANLISQADPDWNELAALVEQAWRMSAGKRALAAFDSARTR
jgi:hypothetical protein